jgi:hypothetical protein
VPQLSQGQFGELHDSLGSDGGFTVNPTSGEALTSGISVAPAGNELRLPASQSSPKSLQEFHEDSGNQQRFDKGASFGGWRSKASGDDFIDTPTVHPNTPEGQVTARTSMLKNNQIAAFELDSFNTLLNPFHSENQSLDISSSDNSPEQQEMWRTMPRRVTKGKKITPTEGMSFS